MNMIDNSPQAVAEQIVDVFQALMKSSSGPIFALATKYDLTFSQLKILMILSNSDRPQALNELADATVLSLPAAGRAVDALVKHDLVSRREDEIDRRVKRVALTELGTEATGRIAQARVAAVQSAVDQLSEEQRSELASALGPLAEILPRPETELEMEASR